MADLPKANEVAELVSLIAFGLAARQAFYSRVPRRNEEASQTILWAVIWSAPLKLIFDAFGLPPWKLGVFRPDDPTTVIASAFTFNLLFSWLFGLLSGVLVSNYTRIKRDSVSERPSQPNKITEFVFRRPPRLDLIQEWLQEMARNRWILVEAKDGRWIAGYARMFDLAQDRATSLHIALAQPVLVDPTTGLQIRPLGDELLIGIEQIRLVRLLPLEPAPVSEKQTSSDPSPGPAILNQLLAKIFLT